MDDERFDALVRRLGGGSLSRRAALTLFTGGSLSALLGSVLPSTEAAKRRRGKRRESARQASHADPRVIGLACSMAQPKGPIRGERCGSKMDVAKHHPPHGCCPGSSCQYGLPLKPVKGKRKGWCYCDDGNEPDPEHQGFCRKIPPRPCVGLNVACNALDVCCDLDGPAVECAIVDPQKGRTRCDTTVGAFVAQCCVVQGTACSNDCECCGALRCQNGVCAPPPDVCHPLAESCDDGEPCCPGSGSCQGGRCCLADGAACGILCSAEADCSACCAGYCRGDGRCGPPQGCVEYGGLCTTGEECCNNVDCTNGRCRFD